MTKNYLPKQATAEQACEWLESQTGERWTLGRLLEHGLRPWFWLDYSPDAPAAVFGGRAEGYLAPVAFGGDIQRLEADGREVLVTITLTHDQTPMKFGPPGLRMSVDELRFKREDVQALRKAPASQPEGVWPTQPPTTSDRFTPEEKAHAVAELREWCRLDTWTVRDGLLLLAGIDPSRSDCLSLNEAGFKSGPQPSWARITARPGVAVDDAGMPHPTGFVFDPFQIESLSRLLNMWVSKPGHTLSDRHAPSYYLEWATGKGCGPFWHPWVIDAGLFPAAAAPERAGTTPLKMRQDNRLARLRELGGNVVRKNGGLRFNGITILVASEAAARAPARDEKTVRADLKAAYERETESKRRTPFSGLCSR